MGQDEPAHEVDLLERRDHGGRRVAVGGHVHGPELRSDPAGARRLTRIGWWIFGGLVLLVILRPRMPRASLTDVLARYSSIALAAFVVVCVAVIVFRYRKPEAPRTFRLPFMPVVPAFGVVASGFLISQLHWETWLRFVVWLAVGLALYFGYGRRHSLMNPDSPRLKAARDAARDGGDSTRAS